MKKSAVDDTSPHPLEEALNLEEPDKPRKANLVLKILAILMIIAAVVALPTIALIIVSLVMDPTQLVNELGATTTVIVVVLVFSLLASAVVGGMLGITLLRSKLRNARRIADIVIVITIISMLCELMLAGLSLAMLSYAIRLIIVIIIATYIDPTLSQERRVQRALRKMETRDEVEKGTLGRDESGRGYIKLDFCNIFWIFVICCVIGVLIETVYVVAKDHILMDRAGMLYGPFSPIYGFGALLMTVALNRFYKKPIIFIFFFSALIGGAFEYLVSWLMEFAFGIVAWDYTGTFLSIDGRTNGMYMFFWGLLGCLWIKLALPNVLKLVNLIPWNLRYTATTIFAAAMIVNGVLTVAALDSWFQRLADVESTSALVDFCNKHYDNEFMEHRFQSMSIDPDKATRT
ncbi:MAG: putative ABC transporter permease [Coriobacteriia bacterium]|nr:putative ABC transporter permease [Coriobacteriia bacterium]